MPLTIVSVSDKYDSKQIAAVMRSDESADTFDNYPERRLHPSHFERYAYDVVTKWDKSSEGIVILTNDEVLFMAFRSAIRRAKYEHAELHYYDDPAEDDPMVVCKIDSKGYVDEAPCFKTYGRLLRVFIE